MRSNKSNDTLSLLALFFQLFCLASAPPLGPAANLLHRTQADRPEAATQSASQPSERPASVARAERNQFAFNQHQHRHEPKASIALQPSHASKLPKLLCPHHPFPPTGSPHTSQPWQHPSKNLPLRLPLPASLSPHSSCLVSSRQGSSMTMYPREPQLPAHTLTTVVKPASPPARMITFASSAADLERKWLRSPVGVAWRHILLPPVTDCSPFSCFASI